MHMSSGRIVIIARYAEHIFPSRAPTLGGVGSILRNWNVTYILEAVYIHCQKICFAVVESTYVSIQSWRTTTFFSYHAQPAKNIHPLFDTIAFSAWNVPSASWWQRIWWLKAFEMETVEFSHESQKNVPLWDTRKLPNISIHQRRALQTKKASMLI